MRVNKDKLISFISLSKENILNEPPKVPTDFRKVTK